MENVPAAELRELWHARCPVPTPLSLAIQLGWIEDALRQTGHIQLRSLPETDESPLPHSFRHGGSVPAIWARARGQQTRVIGLSRTDEYQAVIALPHSGLRHIRELRGRRIGIPRHDTAIDHSRAAALRAFSVILAAEGLSFADMELEQALHRSHGRPRAAAGERPHCRAGNSSGIVLQLRCLPRIDGDMTWPI